MYDTVQTTSYPADKLFFHLMENSHEYRYRTHTGPCDRNINFGGAEVFKLFRSRVFDRRWYLGASAPIASREGAAIPRPPPICNGFS